MPWVSHIPRRSLTDPQGERRQTVGDTHAPISRQPPHACRLSACRAEAVPATGKSVEQDGLLLKEAVRNPRFLCVCLSLLYGWFLVL